MSVPTPAVVIDAKEELAALLDDLTLGRSLVNLGEEEFETLVALDHVLIALEEGCEAEAVRLITEVTVAQEDILADFGSDIRQRFQVARHALADSQPAQV